MRKLIRAWMRRAQGRHHTGDPLESGRHARPAVPDRAPSWPPVTRRVSAGESTELLPLDQYVPHGCPAMVRPYLVAHERAIAQYQHDSSAALAGMAVR
ncbi:hypothetical protein [Allonocardiopsis opalescens]|uniref:hypothetical protein n=1 Tax=Allonocardiopsis opalescens TaxID=1144618 RepID=UPI000D079D5E|nr:hypothetical protein [Allonocardiopsis opalescens]